MKRFLEIRRVLILTLAFNWLVAFSKITYGLITKCASMSADGFHSFGDGASNIIGLVGIWAASKPKDKDHPYGHKKFETMATLGISFILFLAAFNIFRESVTRIFHPVVPDVTSFSFILMFVTLGINIFVMKYERKKGAELSSDILVCDSLHTKSDILASVVVIGTLVSIKMGASILDVVVASLIAIFIAKSGFDILKTSSKVLCDGRVLHESKIKNIAKNVSGVNSVHNIRTRGRKDDIHVDLHVIIDAKMHVDDAHKLSHQIEILLKKEIFDITEVNEHIEPEK